MDRQTFMNEFYKKTDERLGIKVIFGSGVTGGRCALYMAYGDGENPYLTAEQWNDLKDFTYEELLALKRD